MKPTTYDNEKWHRIEKGLKIFEEVFFGSVCRRCHFSPLWVDAS